MALTLRQVFNSVQKSNPGLLDKPLHFKDCDEALEIDEVEFWWADDDGYIMNDECKEEAICDAEYPLHYANQLKKVVVLG